MLWLFPALQETRSTGPCAVPGAVARSNNRMTSSSDVAPTTTASALFPASRMDCATCSTLAAVRPATKT